MKQELDWRQRVYTYTFEHKKGSSFQVSQPTRMRRGREVSRRSPLPAVLSALIVVAVFVVLGIMLASNRPGTAQTGAAPTADSFAVQPTAGAAGGASEHKS